MWDLQIEDLVEDYLLFELLMEDLDDEEGEDD